MQNILIVEDERIMANLLKKKISQAGYKVSVVYDGEEGLKKIKEEKPDLILLDLIMPKISGFTIMEEMKKDQELSSIPIIVVSNSGQPVELDRIKKLGAKDWIIKTEFDLQEVIEKIKRQIK